MTLATLVHTEGMMKWLGNGWPPQINSSMKRSLWIPGVILKEGSAVSEQVAAVFKGGLL